MSNLPSFFFFLLSSIFCFYVPHCVGSQPIVKTITVDPNGQGDFTTVQGAINSIPDGNNQWIRIHINPGIYMEKVTIPYKKSYVILEGEGPHRTFIEWGDHLSVESNMTLNAHNSWDTAAFLSLAEHVILSRIAFKNTYRNLAKPHNAVAALINGDKTSIYGCSFLGIQDTLSDLSGRHYFKDCYIEGIVDFIFGYGQSIYEGCTLHTISSAEPVGYITAQGRQKSTDTNGYVFKFCRIEGSANAYLGRGWGTYSRVFFYKTHMGNIIVPQGWDSWKAEYGGNLTTYAEYRCVGGGSSTSGRVPWEKKLRKAEVMKLKSVSSFINYDKWLDQQPPGYGYISD